MATINKWTVADIHFIPCTSHLGIKGSFMDLTVNIRHLIWSCCWHIQTLISLLLFQIQIQASWRIFTIGLFARVKFRITSCLSIYLFILPANHHSGIVVTVRIVVTNRLTVDKDVSHVWSFTSAKLKSLNWWNICIVKIQALDSISWVYGLLCTGQ